MYVDKSFYHSVMQTYINKYPDYAIPFHKVKFTPLLDQETPRKLGVYVCRWLIHIYESNTCLRFKLDHKLVRFQRSPCSHGNNLSVCLPFCPCVPILALQRILILTCRLRQCVFNVLSTTLLAKWY